MRSLYLVMRSFQSIMCSFHFAMHYFFITCSLKDDSNCFDPFEDHADLLNQIQTKHGGWCEDGRNFEKVRSSSRFLQISLRKLSIEDFHNFEIDDRNAIMSLRIPCSVFVSYT